MESKETVNSGEISHFKLLCNYLNWIYSNYCRISINPWLQRPKWSCIDYHMFLESSCVNLMWRKRCTYYMKKCFNSDILWLLRFCSAPHTGFLNKRAQCKGNDHLIMIYQPGLLPSAANENLFHSPYPPWLSLRLGFSCRVNYWSIKLVISPAWFSSTCLLLLLLSHRPRAEDEPEQWSPHREDFPLHIRVCRRRTLRYCSRVSVHTVDMSGHVQTVAAPCVKYSATKSIELHWFRLLIDWVSTENTCHCDLFIYILRLNN